MRSDNPVGRARLRAQPWEDDVVFWLGLIACGEQTAGSGSASEPHAAAAPAPAPAPGRRTDADVAALEAALAKGVKLLDVRTPEEFAAGHVPGAVNAPLGTFQAVAADPALAGIDPAAETWVICAVGGRSSKAADQLAAGGFTVVNVTGGTNAWVAAGKTVEK